MVFEITSTDVGMFEVTGRFLGRQIEKVELVFQVCIAIMPHNTSNSFHTHNSTGRCYETEIYAILLV